MAPVKTKTVVAIKERRIRSADLSPGFQKFCGNFEAFLVRQISGVSQAKEDKADGKRKI